MIEELKKAMGYKSADICCKKCLYYVPTDISGNIGAKSEHCQLNPAVDVPVEEYGLCNFFKAIK